MFYNIAACQDCKYFYDFVLLFRTFIPTVAEVKYAVRHLCIIRGTNKEVILINKRIGVPIRLSVINYMLCAV